MYSIHVYIYIIYIYIHNLFFQYFEVDPRLFVFADGGPYSITSTTTDFRLGALEKERCNGFAFKKPFLFRTSQALQTRFLHMISKKRSRKSLLNITKVRGLRGPWSLIVKFENAWIFLWHMISRCGELNNLDARNKRCTGASFALSDRTRDSQGLAWCAMCEKLPRISVKLKPISSYLPGQIVELFWINKRSKKLPF